MNIAFNVSPLYRPTDGALVPMAGVHHYINSLLGAIASLLARDQSNAHRVTAFAPLGSAAALQALPAPVDAPGGDRLGRTINRVGLWGARRALRARYDLMHVSAPSYLPLAPLLSDRTLLTATVHDMTIHTHPETHTPENVQAWTAYHEFVLRRADRVFVVSQATRRETLRVFPDTPPDRLVVTYPAARNIAPSAFSDDAARQNLAAMTGGQRFVLYAGTLEPRKNVARLVGAWAQVLTRAPQLQGVRLVLAGGTWANHDEEIKRVALARGVFSTIAFPGYVGDETMHALMTACDAFVYVSLAEGFGLPPLEAMVCGAPVVTSNVSSLPEVVGDAALRVNPESEDEIADALLLLLTDEGENRRRRALSKARAACFSWERTARETVAVWDEIARARESHP